MWSPETLVFIVYLSVIPCSGILFIALVNSLPKLRMNLKRHAGLAAGAIGVAGISLVANGAPAPGYVDIDEAAANAPERIIVAEVAPFGMAERKPKPLPEAEQSTATASGSGDSPLYSVHCIACHGADAQGVEGLGVSLVGSEYVAGSSSDDLVAFLKKGRLPTDPDSVTGVPMPSFSWMPDEDLSAIAAYVQGQAK